MSEVGGWLGQPHIFKALEMKFGDILKNSKAYATPRTPGLTFVKPEIGSELNVNQQKMYRPGVGMLLYLLKHSRPDLSNPIRELSRGMDLAGLVHLNELKRVVKYGLGLRLGLGLVDYRFLRDDINEICLEETMEKKVIDIVKIFEDVTGEHVSIYETPGIPGYVLETSQIQLNKLLWLSLAVGLAKPTDIST